MTFDLTGIFNSIQRESSAIGASFYVRISDDLVLTVSIKKSTGDVDVEQSFEWSLRALSLSRTPIEAVNSDLSMIVDCINRRCKEISK